ncbi:hypothetical protein E1B28_003696 [Marasmius oreades]|uniref:Prolyl 4-hydroxylase alpha subunit Fe(2+) 2OG dioxygenase domain-containing protein n=1 Tax=Marasmius oreades TaxID=181124 RepID=A0A9P7UX38_9AGAR|nr:uncharacterized protein E1B28_003696 [Marasmius oreades]KAG7096247.1 hypothetical protein E1B28_003696 [Marasmius oreades]
MPPVKLNYTGSFFRAHKDTPHSKRMFRSLIVVFPTPHTGGELVLHHVEKTLTFNSGMVLAGSPDKIAFVAFFSDVDHEILPVKSGHRVTLTYNLYHLDPASSQLPPNTEDVCLELGLGVSIKSVIQDTSDRYEAKWKKLKVPKKARFLPCIMMDKPKELKGWGSAEVPLVDHFVERELGTLIHPYDKKFFEYTTPAYSGSLPESPQRSKVVVWISELEERTGGGYELPFVAWENEQSTMEWSNVAI